MTQAPAMPLRGLFCGAGHFANIQLDAWRAVPGARIVALYNRTLERTHALQRAFGIDIVSDNYEALLDSVRPDFVDICTAVETHLPLARAAAERGVPVLCQKPLTPSLADSEQLVAIAAAKGARLMANDNWRWQAWYRETKRLLARGRLASRNTRALSCARAMGTARRLTHRSLIFETWRDSSCSRLVFTISIR
ncbi:MAG: Gfo/Idh/MocA family protein [Opitutaceae bacterium]